MIILIICTYILHLYIFMSLFQIIKYFEHICIKLIYLRMSGQRVCQASSGASAASAIILGSVVVAWNSLSFSATI